MGGCNMAYKYNFSLSQTISPQEVEIYKYDNAITLCTFSNTKYPFYVLQTSDDNKTTYDIYFVGYEDIPINYVLTTYLNGNKIKEEHLTCIITKTDYKNNVVSKVVFRPLLFNGDLISAGGYILKGLFSIDLPIFKSDDETSIINYIKNGDTSGAIKDIKTKWTLAIDGTKSPLYKLKWKCASISENDIARVKIGYGGYDDISGKVSIHKWQLVDYSPSHFNTNYAQINNAVWGEVANIVSPLATLATVYIAVQLEYYSTPTVLPTDYSSIMYCELFKKQKNGHMYGDIGFLEKDENGLYDKVTSGDGSTFTVKDGDEGSKIVTSDDDDGYSDDKDDDENDNDTSDVSSGIGVLTTTFKMTKDRLQQLGRFLWGSNIFDNFSLICNNPIENIISCKSIPLSLKGVTQKIILGNVDTGVNGDKVSNNFAKQNIGSIAITEKYHNFLDYAPYTNVIIYLPYVGFKELDTNLVMGKTLSISYTIDIITGGCLCQITSNKVKLYEFNGNMGIDIPITASNRAQVEAGYISSGIGIASSVASGNIVGAVTSLINSAESQYHYASTSSPNPMCVASTNRTCYVILDRPTYQTLKSFNHTRGKKCYLTKTINSLKGYTICDEHIDLSGIRATESEKEELVRLLSGGFFVN